VAQHNRQRAEFWGKQVAVQLRQLAAHHAHLRASMAEIRQTHLAFRQRCTWAEDHPRRALTKLLTRLTVAPG
jgi:hypothetical protein